MGSEPVMVNPFIEHPATFRPVNGGEQWRFTFANGRGASVVRHNISYGNEEGLWELAVLDSDDRLDYSTPITDDVLGHLSVSDVRDVLDRIAQLS